MTAVMATVARMIMIVVLRVLWLQLLLLYTWFTLILVGVAYAVSTHAHSTESTVKYGNSEPRWVQHKSRLSSRV